MLKGWIEDIMETLIDENKIYYQNLRPKFERFLNSNNYPMPKTEAEAIMRIEEFIKKRHIGRKTYISDSSIKVVSLDSIQNNTAKSILKF